MATSQQLIRWPHFPFIHAETLPVGGSADSSGKKIGSEESDSLQETLKLNQWIASQEIICSTRGRGKLWLGDAQGRVYSFNRQLVLDLLLQAYSPEGQLLHMAVTQQHPYLFTIGTDEGSPSAYAFLKIWHMEKLDKNRMPFLLKTVKLQFQGESIPVTAFAVAENLSHVAVGLLNGAVLLFKGDITRERSIRQRILNEDGQFQGRVTGLFFKDALIDRGDYSSAGGEPQNFLTMVTEHAVLGFHLRSRAENIAFVDTMWGANTGCSTVDDRGNVVIARPESLVSYTVDGRGPLWILDGEKAGLRWYRTYAVVWLFKKELSGVKFSGTLLIIDVRNKFVALSKELSSPILFIENEWNQLLVATQDHHVQQMQELDILSRLDSLYEKNLYSLAVKLAEGGSKSNAVEIDSDLKAGIYQKYADYLHHKGDYDGAAQQYVQTIGKLEPSYVIRRFLDAQRIQNLTTYLQALHSQALATADHTTLLLNCYTKLRDIKKLDEFIKSDSDLYFDVKTAIQVCRQAGYFEHAAYLAKKFDEHEAYISIQLENSKNYREAIQYVSKLGFLEAEKVMKLHGKVLVDNIPLDATRFLLQLCLGYTGSNKMITIEQDKSKSSLLTSNPKDFIHIFVDQKSVLIAFLEEIIVNIAEKVDSSIWNTLLELYLTMGSQPADIPSFGISDVSAEPHQLRFSTCNEPALALLKHPQSKYDSDHALVLVRVHNYVGGLLYLYEKQELYQELLSYFMSIRDFQNLWTACTRFGYADRELWVKVLSFFASQPRNCRKELDSCLQMIESHNLLSPLRVIELLAQNPEVELDVVKSYIVRKIQKQYTGMEADRELITSYQEQISKMKLEIEETIARPQVFQASKCSSCSTPLDLPAVHFFCRHSYHLRCLGLNESRCPKCAPDLSVIQEQQKTQELNSLNHDQFFAKLEQADDTFGVISDYFGRNIFADLPQ